MPHMAPVQKVKKGRPLAGFPNTDPVVSITVSNTPQIVDVPAASGEFVATAIDAEEGDIASSLVWTTLTVVETSGNQTVDTGGETGGVSTGLLADTPGDAVAAISGGPAGTVVPGIAASVYAFDVTIDGGGLQQLTITTVGGEDYDGIVVLMEAVPVVGGTVTFVGGAGFVVTSDSTGVASTVVLAVGTGAAAGGDLFAAIDAAATVTTTFPAPTVGTTTVYTASIVVDSFPPQPISIVGDDAQTYTALLNELNTDTGNATWTLTTGASGGLLATSDLSGSATAILITDTDLFASLTQFDVIAAAIPGTDDVFGVVGTGAMPVITFPLIGAQTLTATATDAFAATGFDTTAVTVNAP